MKGGFTPVVYHLRNPWALHAQLEQFCKYGSEKDETIRLIDSDTFVVTDKRTGHKATYTTR